MPKFEIRNYLLYQVPTQKNRSKKQKIKKIICRELNLAPSKEAFAGKSLPSV